MLHIDPQACVDCGACVSACPVDAIVPESKLTDPQRVFLSINADFYKEERPRPLLAKVIPAAPRRQGPTAVARCDRRFRTVGDVRRGRVADSA